MCTYCSYIWIHHILISQPVDSFVSGLMLFLLSVFLQLFLKLFIFICISHPVLYVLWESFLESKYLQVWLIDGGTCILKGLNLLTYPHTNYILVCLFPQVLSKWQGLVFKFREQFVSPPSIWSWKWNFYLPPQRNISGPPALPTQFQDDYLYRGCCRETAKVFIKQ